MYARTLFVSATDYQASILVASNHLLDLKGDLEDGDMSNAELLVRSQDERLHRTFISSWLKDRSNGRYHCPQEEELADAKRPDIRVHGRGSLDSPIPIELKIADKWTGTQLFERLENQLVKSYLRDAQTKFGIYLLTYTSDKATWEDPSHKG